MKRVLRKFINAKLESKDFDSEILLDSTIDDVDPEAVELFKDALRESKIKDLFGVRELDKILEYIDAGKIDYTGTFHLNKAGALFFAKDIKDVHFLGYVNAETQLHLREYVTHLEEMK